MEKNTTNDLPNGVGTLDIVEVEFRNGSKKPPETAGFWHNDDARFSNWYNNGKSYDIVSYRMTDAK